MHIPDGFLPLPQAAVYWIIALVFIALSLRWARREMSEDKVPLIAVLAAGIFAIQTLNMALPVSIIPGGVSGHVVGRRPRHGTSDTQTSRWASTSSWVRPSPPLCSARPLPRFLSSRW